MWFHNMQSGLADSLGTVLSEVTNVFGQVYRSILSSPTGVFIFLVALPNKPGSFARVAASLANLGLNMVFMYAYPVSQELVMNLLVYEAKEGLFEEAIRRLREGGAVVQEAYEVRVTRAVR